MNPNVVRLGEIAEQIRGVTFSKSDSVSENKSGSLPILTASNITDDGIVMKPLQYVPATMVQQKQRLRKFDILVTASSGSLSVVGRSALVAADLEAGFGAFCKVMRPGSQVDARYLAHFMRTAPYRREVSRLAAGANINNLRNEDLDGILIPLPALGEQRRIASVLDQATSIAQSARSAIGTVSIVRQAVFAEMFEGSRSADWQRQGLGSVALKYSDGPFGSNLKSSDYVEDGVRVVRLQNIGAGFFVDNDRAYVSRAHFEHLRKHECVPGDVLIGTMGEPNLRACIQPASIDMSINKADVVQLRGNPKVVTPEYLVGLLNSSAVVARASTLVLGQTRGRISMGRLRGFEIPVPPIALQRDYTSRVAAVDQVAEIESRRSIVADELFASLQHRAFTGQL